MNWDLMLKEGKLLYASEEKDRSFRKLRLRELLYAVRYYVAHPLTPIDSAIIETLQYNGGVLNDLEFAHILGFNVIDDLFEKRYQDPAEKEIFDRIIKEVAKFALIAIYEHTIKLTPLGYRAIQDGVKYEFRKGYKPLMEFMDIRSKDEDKLLMFPFYSALGLMTYLQDAGALDYEEFNDTAALNNVLAADNQLIQRFDLQSATCSHIFEASIANGDFEKEKRIRDIYVDFRLYQLGQDVAPVAFYQDHLCSELNELLANGQNEHIRSVKRSIGMYHYVVRKTTLPLSFTNLSPYADYWQIPELISNSRFVWNDEELFDAIKDKSTGNDWTQISKRCPISDLEKYIPRYVDLWEWTVLSYRCSDEYVARNINVYPWDFSVLSSERSIDFLKPLIIKPELNDREWDWDIIVPQLDIPFVVDNLSTLDIDLHDITEPVLESYPQSILQYPNKRWNWLYISQEAPLQFILSHIRTFGNNVILSEVADRAFSDPDYAIAYCQSKDFDAVVSEQFKDNYFSANHKEYSWSPTLIDWLEAHNWVAWTSTPNMVGLECNPFIVWDEKMFERYRTKNFTTQGWEHISSAITSTKIVASYMGLPWNWQILSQSQIVQNDLDFIVASHRLLNMSILLPALSPEYIAQLYDKGILQLYLDNEELRALITEYVPYQTIVEHILENWDWKVLTRRFCTRLKIENFGKKQWIDKWDWDYLSENFDIEIIKAQLEPFADKWNWTILTQRLEHDYIIRHLQQYAWRWDWEVITNQVLVPSDLKQETNLTLIANCVNILDDDVRNAVWDRLSVLIPTEDALQIITRKHDRSLYRFNYINIYNRHDFDIENYLSTCLDARGVYIDWDALSRSKSLNAILEWNKKVVKDFRIWSNRVIELLSCRDYSWNFKYLSQLSNINWCDAILKIRTKEWDWDYLSEHSQMFHGSKNIVKHIQDFAPCINFDILSRRADMLIKEKDFEKIADFKWSWKDLSKNPGIEISSQFILAHAKYDWDWFEVSGRRDFDVLFDVIATHPNREWNWEAIANNKKIIFDIQQFLSLLDKPWDWSAISKRTDIAFVEDVVKALADYPLNWTSISRRDDFEVSIASISLLKDKGIDWNAISSRPDLSFEFINKFKDYLDWHVLTKSTSIDIANSKYLDAFYDYLDWKYISISPLFKVDKQNLENFKYYLDWRFISARREFTIDLVDEFEDFIDWTHFSRATRIKLTPEIIEKYAEKWDWVELSENANFAEFGLENYYETKLNLVRFYNHIKDVRTEPSIYHFTHLFNAIEILRSRKILSRNMALNLGLLKYDAAGSVVNKTTKAHKYVRFYFRTGTQTQFYNECLGRQVDAKYYSNAVKNGLPMCPMPVFFKFDLQEVLTAYGDECFYSTGNMQASSTSVLNASQSPNGLTIDTLFSNGHSKEEQEKRQQEFLIPNEFDFSRFKNYQIICYNRDQREILESMFEGDPICDHITSVESSFVEEVFMKENPRLIFNIEDDTINITTTYHGDYHFQITGDDLSSIRVMNKQNTINDNRTEINLRQNVNIETDGGSFEIYYVCDNPKARCKKWLIYKQ